MYLCAIIKTTILAMKQEVDGHSVNRLICLSYHIDKSKHGHRQTGTHTHVQTQIQTKLMFQPLHIQLQVCC